MFTTIEQFINCWGDVSQSAIKILETLTDESLSQEIAPGYRSLGRIAWHIVQTVPEMMGQNGPSKEEWQHFGMESPTI